MLAYDFMQNAFMAAGITAVLAGCIGYILVLRGETFAGHALSHVAFAGATGAALLGLPALVGLVALPLLAALGIGAIGERLQGRDVAIGLVLSLALGAGLLFLHFYTSFAAEATALLFGNVLGVSAAVLRALLGLAAAALAVLAVLWRPLVFATLQPDVAEARGVRLRLVSMLFLALVAVTVAACAQIVGVLLVFALLVGPAAAALRLTSGIVTGLALSVLLALVESGLGLVLAYETDWPTSFWIAAASFAGWALAASLDRLRRTAAPA